MLGSKTILWFTPESARCRYLGVLIQRLETRANADEQSRKFCLSGVLPCPMSHSSLYGVTTTNIVGSEKGLKSAIALLGIADRKEASSEKPL